ncbi:MAG: heme NO-binding domain-containing protein, partial [Hyphomicrobiaceae bacterium]
MKGIVLVELIKMAEDAFGEDVVDQVLDEAELSTDGAFTSVGNYPCSDLVKIVEGLSADSGVSGEILQKKFGHWMMEQFGEKFPESFVDKSNSMELLEAVEEEIHVEVRKLYPDAELPRFDTRRISDDHLRIVYTSPRPLEAFCYGLIEASVDRFGERAVIEATKDDAP